MGAVIVVSAVYAVVNVLLVNIFIGVAHHRRDEIAVLPIGVTFVTEHGFFGGVFFVFEGNSSFGGGEGGGNILMLDYEGGDIVAEVFGSAPGHGAVHEDGSAEGLREVRGLMGIAEDERTDYHGALGRGLAD